MAGDKAKLKQLLARVVDDELLDALSNLIEQAEEEVREAQEERDNLQEELDGVGDDDHYARIKIAEAMELCHVDGPQASMQLLAEWFDGHESPIARPQLPYDWLARWGVYHLPTWQVAGPMFTQPEHTLGAGNGNHSATMRPVP